MNRKRSTTSDGQLVALAVQRDQQAFGEIYDRYADDIYTFCRSRLRNDADAGDAMQETFVRAATRLDQLREPDKLRSWIFAIARNQIVATGKASARAIGGDDMGEVIDLRPDVDDDLLRAEASAELWDAAAGLSDRDQEVLELHVRHGLSGQALADAMGVSESHANVMMTRMRDRIATSLGGLLVARSGREDCDELDMLLAGWDGRFTIDLRSKVTRHVRSCEVCERTQGAALAAGAFLLPVMEVPAGLRSTTLGRMVDAANLSGGSGAAVSGGKLQFAAPPESAASTWEWRPDGFPHPDQEPAVAAAAAPVSSSLAWMMSAAAFILVVLLGAGAWMLFGDRGETTVAVAGATEVNALAVTSTSQAEPATTGDPTTTGVAAAPDASTTTAEPALEAPTSAPEDDGAEPEPEVAAPATQAPTTVAPTTTEPATTTREPSTTTEEPASTTTEEPAATTTEEPPTTTTEEPAPTTTEEPAPTTTEEPPPTTTEEPPPTTTEEPPPTTTEEPPPPNRAPIIRSVETNPLGVTVRDGACRGGSTQVVVEFVDDGQIVSVVAAWSPKPGSFSEVALTPRSEFVYTGSVGPWDETGPHTITVVVTDDQGETATGQGNVRVTDCTIGGFAG